MDALVGLAIEAGMLLLGSGPLVALRSCPPLLPDPVIARSAPDACFAHVAFHGVAEPDPKSPNLTEQLAADEEIRECAKRVGGGLGQGVTMILSGSDPSFPVTASHLHTVAVTLATRPWSLTIEPNMLHPDAPPDMQASFVMHVGTERDAFVTAVACLHSDTMGEEAAAEPVAEITVAGRPFHMVGPDTDAPLIWGFHGDYLVALATGGKPEDEFETLLGRIDDQNRQAPAWKTAAEEKVPVERPRTLLYVDAAGLRKAYPIDNGDETQAMPIDVRFLDGIDMIAIGDGMSEQGVQSRLWIGASGEPRVGDASTERPLTAGDLAAIPSNAVFAQAWRFDASSSLQALARAMAAIDPDSVEEVRKAVEQLRAVAGFDPDRHILKTLGDTWHLFLLPVEDATAPPIALSVTLRDRPALVKTHDTLVRLVRTMAASPDSEMPWSVSETPFHGTTIYALDWPAGENFPLLLSWCITNENLIITTSPQLIRTMLERQPEDPGLAAVPAVAAAIAEGHVTMLGYHDPRPLVSSIHDLLAQVAEMDWIDLDASQIPPAATVNSRVTPAVSVVRTVPGKGILGESSCTLPLGPLAAGDFAVLAFNFWFGNVVRHLMNIALDTLQKQQNLPEPEADAEPVEVIEVDGSTGNF